MKHTWIPASAGMTALNSVMPAQAGIQFIFEKAAHDLEKEQIAKIFDRSDGKATELWPCPKYKGFYIGLKLVESLEQKKERGEWIDYLMVKESNAIYGSK